MAQLTLFPLQYQRQDSVPIDIDQVFLNTAAATAYLSSPRRYAGQIAVDLQLEQPMFLSVDKTTWVKFLTGTVVNTVTNSDLHAVSSNAVYNYVQAQIASLIGGAPTLLDTLKEISDAINGDPDFYNTLLTSLSFKADKLVVGNPSNLTSGLVTELSTSGYGSTWTQNGVTTTGSSVIVLTAKNPNFAIGNVITSTGIPTNTTITAISGASVTISASATASGTVLLSTTNKKDLIAAINLLYDKVNNTQPVLTQALTVQLGAGVTFGGIGTGTNFASGSLIENALRALLIKTIPPSYNNPTLDFTTSISTANIEIGSNITPTFNFQYNQNDAGTAISKEVRLNGTALAGSGTTGFVASQIQVIGSANTYQAFASYNGGPCKPNNLGITDCNGQIAANTIGSYNSYQYIGYRSTFYGFPATTPTTSANVRGLASNFLNAGNGTVFNITIPSGAVSVSIVYPDTLRDLTLVEYVELSYSNVTGNFIKTLITSVLGANSYAGIGYKVFTYTPVEVFSQAVNYRVTI